MRTLLTVLISTVTIGGFYGQNPDGKITNDELVRAYPDDPDTLNPLLANDTQSEEFFRHTTEGFAARTVQNPDVWEKQLATDWKRTETEDGKLVFDITLRQGVKWHKVTVKTAAGEKTIEPREFTSNDVYFTYQVMMNPHVRCAAIRSYYGDLEDVKRTGKYSVQFIWKKKYFLAEEFTLGFSPIPRHIFAYKEDGSPLPADVSSEAFAEEFNRHWFNGWICGTGPMKLSVYIPKERVELVRNENYWGQPAYYNKYVYLRVQDDTKRYLMFLKGETDTAGLTPKRYDEIKERKEYKSGEISVETFDYPVYRYLGWNLNRAIFKDRRVRWAFAHATPREKITKTILRGLASVTDGPFNKNSKAYDKTIPTVQYDPEKAKKLLKEAGWEDTDGNGVLEKNIEGKRIELAFTVIIYQGSEDYQKMAEVLRDEYGKVGAKLEILPLPWDQFLKVLKERKFDACILGWALSWTNDPYQIWHSSQADEEDSSNHISYRNKEVDELIETLRYTIDEDKQVEIYHKIHRIIYDDQPYCFLWVDKGIVAYSNRLTNVRFYGTIRPCYDIREWRTVAGKERVK